MEVFFVLSGYLITVLLLREHALTGRIDLLRFSARRMLRLLPALVVVLTVWAVWLALRPGTPLRAETLHGLLPSLLYYANWSRFLHGYAALGWLAPMWSLSVEEQFYLLWPLTLVVLLRSRWSRRWPLLLGAGCVAVVAFRAHDLWDLDATYRRFGTHEIGDQLLVGCALALALSGADAARVASIAAWSRRLTVPALLLLGTVVVTLDEAPPLAYHRAFYTVGLLLVAGAAGVLVARVVADGSRRFVQLAGRRHLAWLGRMSYGVYLWHEFFRMLWTGPVAARSGLLFLLVGACSVAAAAVSHRVVEQPFLRLKSRLAVVPAGEPLRRGALR